MEKTNAAVSELIITKILDRLAVCSLVVLGDMEVSEGKVVGGRKLRDSRANNGVSVVPAQLKFNSSGSFSLHNDIREDQR